MKQKKPEVPETEPWRRSEAPIMFNHGTDMKRSASELDFEECMKKTMSIINNANSNDHDQKTAGTESESCTLRNGEIGDGETAGSFRSPTVKSMQESDIFYGDLCSSDLGFSFDNRETGNAFSGCGGQTEVPPHWAQQNHTTKISISATMDSQSSIFVSSPVSADKTPSQDNQVGKSRSSSEQSDNDYLEIEGGSCDQSADNIDLKRIRRMVSNRESARRSRRRKLAHLAELEYQVEQLKGDNASLFKQLTDATQHYHHADTNYSVLKSDVEALRAKGKLAEEMLTRGGSLSCSLNLLQSHLSPNTVQPVVSSNSSLRRVPDVSPTINIHQRGAGDNNIQLNGSELPDSAWADFG